MVRQPGRARFPDGRTPRTWAVASRSSAFRPGKAPSTGRAFVFKAITIKGRLRPRDLRDLVQDDRHARERSRRASRHQPTASPPATTRPASPRCCRESRARSCWTGPEAAKCPSTRPPSSARLAPHPQPEVPMSRFGPTRGELKLRLAISLLGLGLLTGAYAFNGIGGIASLEIGIIGAAFFSADRRSGRPAASGKRRKRTHERRNHHPTHPIRAGFPGLGLASGPDRSRFCNRAAGVGEEIGRWFRSPEDRRDRNTLLFLTFVAGQRCCSCRSSCRPSDPLFAPRAARLDRADGASRLPPPGHAAVGDPRRPRDRAGRQARRPSVGSGQGGASGRLPAGPRSGGLPRGAAGPPARHGHLWRYGLRAHALGPASSRPAIRTPPREKDLPRPRLGRDGGKRPARSTCRSLSTGPTGRCNT